MKAILLHVKSGAYFARLLFAFRSRTADDSEHIASYDASSKGADRKGESLVYFPPRRR